MLLMDARYENLIQTLEGYTRSKIPLVAYYDGVFFPTAFNDDKGLFYFVPLIAHFLNLPIKTAFIIFFGFILLLTYSFSIVGFIKLCKMKISKFIAIFATTLFYVIVLFKITDVYFIPAVITFVLFPWIMIMHKNIMEERKWNKYYIIFFLFEGLSVGISNYIRIYAAIPILFFTLVLFFYKIHFSIKDLFYKKILVISFLLVGISISSLFFYSIERKRDIFLKTNSIVIMYALKHHVIWHNIYIGLGYIKNKYDISYHDEIAYKIARSINPTVQGSSNEYEDILKRECIKILFNDPIFIFKNIFIKIVVLLKYFFYFANFGIICFFIKKNYSLFLPFSISLFISALPGLLTVPFFQYVSSFLAFSTLFGMYYIISFFETRHQKDT